MSLARIELAVVEGDLATAVDLTERALAEGVAAQTLIDEALTPAMRRVGALFEEGQYFLPEMLVAGEAANAATDLLRPHLVGDARRSRHKVVLGTVAGDLHDIGKRLVGMMLEGTGFQVVDLGTNVAPARFAAAVAESGAELVGVSALLTTTLPAMEETIRLVRALGLGTRVMIGGAPVTAAYAERVGADGYAPDASRAATLASRLVSAP